MVDELLSGLLRVNLAAGAAILLVLALRTAAARRFGGEAAYALWAVVPLAATASLLPARRVVVQVAPDAAGAVAAIAPSAAPGLSDLGAAAPMDASPWLLGLWLAGAAACLAVLAARQASFRRMLGPLSAEGGVYRSRSRGVGPVLMGALSPRIIVPADFEAHFNAEERRVVIAHERTHLTRGDHLVNGLAALAQCACWFNPLVHLAAPRLRADQELACDAAVVAQYPKARRSYAEAMLKTQLAAIAPPLGCHWPAVGPAGLKARIALLRQGAPSGARRGLGLALALGLTLGGGLAAWAAQPPQRVARLAASPVGTEGGWQAERRQEAQRAQRGGPLGAHLVEAALAGDLQDVERLIAAGADVNASLTGDGSPLIVAAREGRTDIAGRLISAGADVNGFVLYDETPLINAARAGHLAMVELLVERGADPNRAVPSGNRPGEMRSPLGMARSPAVRAYLKRRGARS